MVDRRTSRGAGGERGGNRRRSGGSNDEPRRRGDRGVVKPNGRGGRRGGGRGNSRGGAAKRPTKTKEDLDKELENFLMKDDERRDHVKQLKKQELDEQLEKYNAAKAADEDEAPAEEETPAEDAAEEAAT